MLARLPYPGLPLLLLLLLTSALLAALATYGIVSSQPANGVYDTDGDGLIEISTLEQLDAIRHDTDGNGRVDNESGEAYHAAFPVEDGDRVCRQGCNGYELTRSLDFDRAGQLRLGEGQHQMDYRQWVATHRDQRGQVQSYL